MSQNNGELQLSDGLFRCRMPDGALVAIDPVDFLIEANVAIDALESAEKKGFQHLEHMQKWLEGRQIKLTLAQTEELWRAVRLESARAAKLFTDELASLSSTASMPAD